MPDSTSPDNITWPLPGDLLKDPSVESALSDIIRSTANSTQVALNSIHATDAAQNDRLTALDGQGQRGYTIDETAGRKITVWDYLNNREQLIYGDTGLRFVEPDNLNGSVYLRRVGTSVTVYFRDWFDDVTPSGPILTLPGGFRPQNSPAYGFLGRTGSRQLATYDISAGVITQGTAHAVAQYAQLTLQTNDPWPSTLPGTAVGTIPNE